MSMAFAKPFNRTSMELKQMRGAGYGLPIAF